LFPFNGIGVRFALGDFIDAPVIPRTLIGIKSIAVAAPGFGRFIHHLLSSGLRSFPDHFETQIATGGPIYNSEDVDCFFSPMKMNSSSHPHASEWLSGASLPGKPVTSVPVYIGSGKTCSDSVDCHSLFSQPDFVVLFDSILDTRSFLYLNPVLIHSP